MTLFTSRFRALSLRSARLVAFAAAAVVVIAPLAPATAQQDVRPLIERMERLERDITTLQRQTYRGDAPPARAPQGQQGFSEMPGDLAGRLQVRMGELERLVQELTGRVEQTQFQVRQTSERLDQFIKDVDFRLTEIEGRGAGATAAADAPAGEAAANPAAPSTARPSGAGTGQGVLGVMPTGSGASPAGATPVAAPMAASGSPREQYDAAFAMLRRGDYPAAEAALSAFLKANPNDDLAGNAQYWLGETHYVRGDFQKAAVAFLDGYRTYPKNSKAPDNLLKLGIAMGRLGQKTEACAALQRLISEYPQAPDVIKRRAVSEREQFACK